MERQEIVNNIKEAFNQVAKAFEAVTDMMRAHMDTQIATILSARNELNEDCETLSDIISATEAFSTDVVDKACESMDNTLSGADYILGLLADIPDKLKDYEVEEDSEENTDTKDENELP